MRPSLLPALHSHLKEQRQIEEREMTEEKDYKAYTVMTFT